MWRMKSERLIVKSGWVQSSLISHHRDVSCYSPVIWSCRESSTSWSRHSDSWTRQNRCFHSYKFQEHQKHLVVNLTTEFPYPLQFNRTTTIMVCRKLLLLSRQLRLKQISTVTSDPVYATTRFLGGGFVFTSHTIFVEASWMDGSQGGDVHLLLV